MSFNPELGTQWINNHGRLCTVIDIFTTTNCKGETVKVEWLSKHDFLGQCVTHTDGQVTIAKGMDRLNKR